LKTAEAPSSEPKTRTLICDIQRFSIHDGPGIRTTVFFKGCPLRCLWCQNPETLRFENELVFNPEKCIACGECEKTCVNKAIKFDRAPILVWQNCKSCFACAEACPSRAREPAGKEYTPEQLALELLKDREFYIPEGGVTLSGGEPFSHAKYLLELLPILKKEKIHVAVETCGHFNWDAARPALDMIDLVLFDLKALNPELHEKLTGKDNQLILKNLRKLVESKKPHLVRVPVIPGNNDSEIELAAMAKFLKEDLQESEVQLLAYHRLGESKLKKLNTSQTSLGLSSMTEKELKAKSEIFARRGIKVIS
jgi:pyruvate formate lyase activating enzyme